MLQLNAGFPAGVQGRNQAARRGTCYQRRADARLFQHLNHTHMRKAARRAAAQGQTDAGRHLHRRHRYCRRSTWGNKQGRRLLGGAAAQKQNKDRSPPFQGHFFHA